MFETLEHVILPIIIALLTGGLVAGVMSQRTAAKVAYIDGLKNTVLTMQSEMDHMAERMNAVRLELSSNAVTIGDLRSQISTLQSRNFDLVDQVTNLKHENIDLRTQVRSLLKEKDGGQGADGQSRRNAPRDAEGGER